MCSFAIDGENITINGLYTDAASETAREAAYKIYLFPCIDQEETLVNLLAARRSLAQLCGFPSYAHRALQGSLAADPETVLELLDGLTDQLRPRAAADYNTMRDMKKRQSRHSQVLEHPSQVVHDSERVGRNPSRMGRHSLMNNTKMMG